MPGPCEFLHLLSPCPGSLKTKLHFLLEGLEEEAQAAGRGGADARPCDSQSRPRVASVSAAPAPGVWLSWSPMQGRPSGKLDESFSEPSYDTASSNASEICGGQCRAGDGSGGGLGRLLVAPSAPPSIRATPAAWDPCPCRVPAGPPCSGSVRPLAPWWGSGLCLLCLQTCSLLGREGLPVPLLAVPSAGAVHAGQVVPGHAWQRGALGAPPAPLWPQGSAASAWLCEEQVEAGLAGGGWHPRRHCQPSRSSAQCTWVKKNKHKDGPTSCFFCTVYAWTTRGMALGGPCD